ncbi:MAG: PEP-CTERM sorting domain-containing protein [Gallionellaceae bacterium]|nr:PEP-CTERM sorting domain-containing protein [Gallionellaceae bacterium]
MSGILTFLDRFSTTYMLMALIMKTMKCLNFLIFHGGTALADIGAERSAFKSFYQRGFPMRALLSLAVLLSVAMPAFADGNLLPEPESLSLLAIGAVGLLVALRRKK